MEEELSRDQELQGKRKSSYVVNMLAALVLVLIIVAGALVYLYVRESRESVRIEEVLQNERDSLQGNLERVVSDYDALKTDNAALQEKLDVEKQRAQDLLDEVKRVRQVSYGKIKEYQRERGTLRAIMRKMVGEIDSLNTLNKALVAENTKVRTEYQESQRNVEKLSEERAELAARGEKGAAGAQARVMSADGASDNAGELIREKRRQGSSVVRICVILGFVLTGSMLYLPPLAWLASFFDPDGNPPAVAMNLAFLSALLFIAPFGMLAFLCALLVRFFEKGKERDQERSE